MIIDRHKAIVIKLGDGTKKISLSEGVPNATPGQVAYRDNDNDNTAM